MCSYIGAVATPSLREPPRALGAVRSVLEVEEEETNRSRLLRIASYARGRRTWVLGRTCVLRSGNVVRCIPTRQYPLRCRQQECAQCR